MYPPSYRCYSGVSRHYACEFTFEAETLTMDILGKTYEHVSESERRRIERLGSQERASHCRAPVT